MNRISSQSIQKWLQKDRRIWIKSSPKFHNPFQDAFLQGKIIQMFNEIKINKQKQIKVVLTDSKQQHIISYQNCLKLTYGLKDVPDMVDLQQLNQPELLFNIKRRYVQDNIFTYCGPTLLIINPYCKIQKLFNDHVLLEYQSLVFSDTLQYKNLVPHIFGLSAFCLWQLFDNERNQSIVISGQSGAGKTENTKYCLKFLASLGKNIKQLINDPHRKVKMHHNLRFAQKAIKKTNSKVFGIQQKILGCNQILQAFGNSKTIRNDNSSRFGKLILLVYGQTQIQIKSAFIISYLLQKSRIVNLSEGERNYHIFYYLIKGTQEQQKKKYFLSEKTQDYFYLNQSSVQSIPGIDDRQKFLQIKKQFQLYLSLEQIDTVLKILAVVLNLGNLKFKKQQNQNNEQICIIINRQYLENISKLLEINTQQFEHSFTFKTRKMGLSIINCPLKYDQAISLRDSFAKNIYEKTFNFLIKKLNQKIEIQQINLSSTSSQINSNANKVGSSFRKSIGLLDIFGFQVLTINSLQQFFINFANEKLQQLYVSYIFKEEQNQFMKQGLKQYSHDIGFQDNKPIIDLFQHYPLGIFHLINEASQLNKDDIQLPEAINKNHGKNIFLKIPKTKKCHFQISHSCSPVSYNTLGFTAKNKDQFPQQLLAIIQKTENKQIKKICIGQQNKEALTIQTNRQKSSSTPNTGTKASKKFLGTKFLNEMNNLIEELYSCDCHFVRCIKPNSKKSPKFFNSQAVLQSLRYLGVLDSIIIRKLGFIYRRPFKQFYKKFYQIDDYIFSFHDDMKVKNQEDFKRQCQRMINKYAQKQFNSNDILFGHKKILIRQSTLNHLESLLKQKKKQRINSANRFKNMYKNAVFRMKVKIFLNSIKIFKHYLINIAKEVKDKILNQKVTKIQNVIKKFLLQRRFQKIKEQATKSVTKISAYFKMKTQRRKFLLIKQKSIQLQSTIRAYLMIGKILRYRKCQKLVGKLYQNAWNFIRINKAIIIQKIWKGLQTRKQYKKAMQEIKKSLRLSRIRMKFKRAFFQHNYNKFSLALKKYKKPILKLQAIAKGRKYYKKYKEMKKSTILIQRAYRKHLKKKFYFQKFWSQYKKYIKQNQIKKLYQMRKVGVNLNLREENKRIKNISQTTGIVITFSPQQMIQKYLQNIIQNDKQSSSIDWKLNSTINFPDKNTIQLYIADYDSLSNEYTQGQWLYKFSKLKQELRKKMEFIIYLQITQKFTIFISNKDKVYKFYHEEEQRCIQISGLETISTIGSFQDGNIIVNEENQIYQWGNINYDSKTTNILTQCPYLMKKNIKNIISKGQNNYLFSENGTLYYTLSLNKQQLQLKIIQFPQKQTVKEVSSSYFFTHFLTNTGLIYSKGRNNRGQLGLGFKSRNINELTLNNELKKLKQNIQSISVGMGHTVAKSKLGYLYVWGDNSFGQIGIDQQSNQKPRKLEINDKNLKVYQAVAGLRSTYFLTENLKIFGLGCSLTFNSKKNNNQPCQLTLFQNTHPKSKFISFLKLRCSWTRQNTVLSVNAIDVSQCKQGSKPDAILKYLKSLGKQWIENTIYPLYHQFLDNTLNLSDLRKLKFKSKNSPFINVNSVIKKDKKKNDKLTRIQQLKMLIQLKKNSSMFKQAIKTKVQQFLYDFQKKKNSNQNIPTQQEDLYAYIMNQAKWVLK